MNSVIISFYHINIIPNFDAQLNHYVERHSSPYLTSIVPQELAQIATPQYSNL